MDPNWVVLNQTVSADLQSAVPRESLRAASSLSRPEQLCLAPVSIRRANGHGKADPADRFIIERRESIEQLFGPGDLEVPTLRAWHINPAALDRPSAYRAIIG